MKPVAIASLFWSAGIAATAKVITELRERDALIEQLEGFRAEAEITMGSVVVSASGNNRNVRTRDLQEQQCQFCGTRGQCGRTEPLGNYFTVSVSGPPFSLWIVSCDYPNVASATCHYPVNGDPVYSARPGVTLALASLICPCCNFVLPRTPEQLEQSNDPFCQVPGNCDKVERICLTSQQTTFSCPVGSLMFVVGADSRAVIEEDDVSSVLAFTDVKRCTHSGRSLRCNGDSVVGVYGADDCSCVDCTGNVPRIGQCASPIRNDVRGEGVCAPAGDICSVAPLLSEADAALPPFNLASHEPSMAPVSSFTSPIPTPTAPPPFLIPAEAGTSEPSPNAANVFPRKSLPTNMPTHIPRAAPVLPNPPTQASVATAPPFVAALLTRFPTDSPITEEFLVPTGQPSGLVDLTRMPTMIATRSPALGSSRISNVPTLETPTAAAIAIPSTVPTEAPLDEEHVLMTQFPTLEDTFLPTAIGPPTPTATASSTATPSEPPLTEFPSTEDNSLSPSTGQPTQLVELTRMPSSV